MNAARVSVLCFLWITAVVCSAQEKDALAIDSDRSEEVTTYIHRAEYYLPLDTQVSRKYADSAYALAMLLTDSMKMASAFHILSGLNNQISRHQQAIRLLTSAFEIQESIVHNQKVQQQRRIYWALIPALLVFFVMLTVIYYLSKLKTRKLLKTISTELVTQETETQALYYKLAASEARYQSLLEKSPLGILLLDHQGKILEVNKKMIDILGSPGPEETKKINCLEFAPLQAIGLTDDIIKCIQSGESQSRRTAYQSKWNRNLHLNYTISPLKDKDGIVKKLILNVEDITQLIQAERLKLESELKYHILVENSLQAMMIVQGGRVIFANTKMEELTLYSVEEIRNAGRRWLNLIIHPEDKRRSYKNVREALSGKEVDTNQVYKIIRKDGNVRIMETLGSVVDIQDHPAMLIVAIDITEPALARDKLMESQEKLRELNAMKDKFFSIIAHDLKNPFSSILGFSNLLYEAYDNFSEKQRKAFIKNICEASENTFKLLHNLLEWSRTQTGKISYIPEDLDLEALIVDNVAILKSGFIRKNIEIEVDVPPNTGVYADENMIKLVLRNLISNALKFTHPGGKVVLTAKQNEIETIITVEDNGVGIDKKNQNRIFRIDDQLKTKGTANESGSGLGLILCKEFIEQNKGKIWVKSRSGQGSSFSFSLPCNKPPS